MDKFEWKEIYSVRIPDIDHQHQYFFLLCKRMINCINKNKPDKMIKFAEELIKYAYFHFYSEELLMSIYHYPGLEEHQEMHHKLLEDLNTNINQLQNNKQKPDEFIKFIINWLLNHTTKEDTKLADFLILNHLEDFQ